LAYKNRKQPIPTAGLGQQDDAIALSVSGQVQKLIEEATNEANLAQMFIGETSFPPLSFF
jgi:hypothetical protein